MTKQYTRSEIARRRHEFIDMIVRQVRLTGNCAVPARECVLGDLDDPPEHPVVTAVRAFEEARASREGRRPHLESPKTLHGELKVECERHGWLIEWNPQTYQHEIIAPVEVVSCPTCGGIGAIPEPIRLDLPMDLTQSQVRMHSVCTACHGTRYQECRKDLAP